MSLRLQPMTEAEYGRWFDHLVEGYAQEVSQNFDTPIERERVRAREQVDGLLTKGVHTPGQRLWVVVTEQGEQVGNLWVAVNDERKDAFIFDIEIDEPHRGKGYAQQTLGLLDEAMRSQGIMRITLNVFSTNKTAQHVYDKQGYRITNYTMQKRLEQPLDAGA